MSESSPLPLSEQTLLVANRGEIACRVIRAARDLGMRTVAIYSDADANAVHRWLADEAHHVGPAASAESYLRTERVLQVAELAGATLLHPGYGFLSENADFREACEAAGVRFVGPKADAMRQMGVKTLARDTMKAAGVPVVPGSEGPLETAEDAVALCREIGFPVMLKAASGGGGKGMRRVFDEASLVPAFEGARREAEAYFADATVYIEKLIEQPRHIEIQVIADSHGHTVHLYERECSVQRRNQKIIEESPAPNLRQATREAMGAVAVKAAEAVGYENAGTIEFLCDADENFYFLEMNTRLQVEHPITELVTGVDLVREQLRVSCGHPLSFTQDDVRQHGHAVECRVYAEDPARGFLPSPGKLRVYRPPHGPGVRVDDGVVEGSVVSRFYDPMIAKLSTWGADRDHAIGRMNAALAQYAVGGIAHNIPYLRFVLACEAFAEGRYDTGLVERLGAFEAPDPVDDATRVFAALLAHRQATRPAASGGGDNAPRSAWGEAARRWAVRGL
jgi:acetyl-CoA carboxylase biotin carboxylase subunit